MTLDRDEVIRKQRTLIGALERHIDALLATLPKDHPLREKHAQRRRRIGK